jgi:hypothetical protein
MGGNDMKEVKKIEKEYSELNAGLHSYPLVNIGNELYLKFDVNDGESVYYQLMHEFEGMVISMGLSLVVYHECKSHLLLEQTEFHYWGYPQGKLNELKSECVTQVNFPISVSLTDASPMTYIEDDVLSCRHCGADKSVNMKLGYPSYICPYWHF